MFFPFFHFVKDQKDDFFFLAPSFVEPKETLAMSEMSLDRASDEKAQIMGHVNPKRGAPFWEGAGKETEALLGRAAI